jgi:two-component system, chemotaxis family, response regulator PixH
MNQVLVVEDSKTEMEKLKRCLEGSGYTVLGVTSGEEAEIRVKQQKPALILLDVILPGESGFELCRKEMDRTWGNMSGADAYLSKSVDEQTLIKTVSQFMN